jgi:hypothetical protein
MPPLLFNVRDFLRHSLRIASVTGAAGIAAATFSTVVLHLTGHGSASLRLGSMLGCAMSAGLLLAFMLHESGRMLKRAIWELRIRAFVGAKPVVIRRGVWRSRNGSRQVRSLPWDGIYDVHIHLDWLQPGKLLVTRSTTLHAAMPGRTCPDLPEPRISHATVAGRNTRQTVRFGGACVLSLKWETAQEHAVPSVLVKLRWHDGSVLLQRWTSNGNLVGDTWHDSEQQAIEQVLHEFGPEAVRWSQEATGVNSTVAELCLHDGDLAERC